MSELTWVWDYKPFCARTGGRLGTSGFEASVQVEQGRNLQLPTAKVPAPGERLRVYNIKPNANANQRRMTQGRTYYVPTAEDLDLIRERIPNGPPENPSWAIVEAKLLQAGHDLSRLTLCNAPTLIRFLPISKDQAPTAYTLGQLISEMEASRDSHQENHHEVRRKKCLEGDVAAVLYHNTVVGLNWHPDPKRAPEIDRLTRICDEQFGGTGLSVENLRRLRAQICRHRSYPISFADSLTLEEAADELEDVQRVSFREFCSIQSELASAPMTALCLPIDIGDRKIPVMWASWLIVKGSSPSVCPNANPPLPVSLLPIAIAPFKRFPNLLQQGETVHWIGHNGWLRNTCKCHLGGQRTPFGPRNPTPLEGKTLQPKDEPFVPSQASVGSPNQPGTGTNVGSTFTFTPSGNGYFVAGFGESGHLSSLKGLRIIAQLLQAQGQLVLMTELLDFDPKLEKDKRSRQETLDKEALKEVHGRLLELKQDLVRAESQGNSVEADVTRQEIESLQARLVADLGLKGKARDLNDLCNALRPKIYGLLKTVFTAMRDAEPPMVQLAEHLELSIGADGGNSFVYRPAGTQPAWVTDKAKVRPNLTE